MAIRHIWWDFNKNLLPLVVYTNAFCWILSSIFWMISHRNTSFSLGSSPTVFFLILLFFPNLIVTWTRWGTTARRSVIWFPYLLPSSFSTIFFNRPKLPFLFSVFTFWVICIISMWHIFHWWCGCHNLPIWKSFQIESSVLCTWEYRKCMGGLGTRPIKVWLINNGDSWNEVFFIIIIIILFMKWNVSFLIEFVQLWNTKKCTTITIDQYE